MPRLSHGVPRRRRRVSSSRTDVRRVDKNASTTSPATKKYTLFSRSENRYLAVEGRGRRLLLLGDKQMPAGQ